MTALLPNLVELDAERARNRKPHREWTARGPKLFLSDWHHPFRTASGKFKATPSIHSRHAYYRSPMTGEGCDQATWERETYALAMTKRSRFKAMRSEHKQGYVNGSYTKGYVWRIELDGHKVMEFGDYRTKRDALARIKGEGR